MDNILDFPDGAQSNGRVARGHGDANLDEPRNAQTGRGQTRRVATQDRLS